MNKPFSWMTPAVFAYRGRRWWNYAGVILLVIPPTLLWFTMLAVFGTWLGLPWWTLPALNVAVGEFSWVTHDPKPGLLQHAAPYGRWYGWPPYYE
jgi:hypothetical protein